MKMKKRALVVLVLLACRKPAPPGEAHGHADDDQHEGTPAAETGQPAQAGIVRIDPEMVRDLRVKTAVVERRPGGDAVNLLGELRVNEDAYAEIGTPIPARIARLFAAPGDKVAAGTALCELESVALAEARATASKARAHAELARATAARKRQLVAERIAAGREQEEAEAETRAAEAELRAAETTLHALGAEGTGAGARFTLRAPIAGTVLERKAARGQVVTPEVRLFRVADLTELWLTVHAFERDALRLAKGAAARVSFPALPGRSFAGKVAFIGAEVDVTSRTIPVRVTVASDGVLRPGMSATALIAVGDRQSTVVAVPSAALQRVERNWVVFLPGAKANTFVMRAVGRGRDLGGEVEIVSHLAPGETVVVDGAFLIKAEAEKARGMGEHHEH